MAIERDELRLVWPAPLFAAEAQALLDTGCSREAMEWLLDEAFADGRAHQLLTETGFGWSIPGHRDDDPWATGTTAATAPSEAVALVQELIRDADRLPRYTRPRYWSTRRRPPEPPPSSLSVEQTRDAFADVVRELDRNGYFEDAFGTWCSNTRGYPPDPHAEGQRRLSALLDADIPLWPIGHPDSSGQRRARVVHGWPTDLFCDVVEALHDLVARPRRRYWHDYCEAWEYDDFARRPGQTVYRWKVNDILARSDLGLQLAETGEDAGRLVHAVTDDRYRLVEQTLTTANPTDRQGVGHAVALFRARDADRDDKRSAVVALARILEDRRPLIHTELGKKDENALFNIANEFDLRHRNRRQQGDYDEAFLDWIFWWYLATVELTDRLLARQP